MLSLLCDIESSLTNFFRQVTSAIKFNGLFAIAICVEIFFIFLFLLRSAFSYELRLRRSLDKVNGWLFKNKKLDKDNIKEFNELVKKGPKRLVYYWQQFILYREKEPTYYMSMDNLVEKPLKSSGFANNIKNLNIVTCLWSAFILLMGVAYQFANGDGSLRLGALVGILILPVLILVIGYITTIVMHARKIANLDEIYHMYHIFARFINNASVDLPPYIDYDILFSPKEIEKGNPQLREYYETRARKAKEEFEKAKQSDIEYVEYNFQDAGVDGSLVLERAMKESESFSNKKSSTLAKIAHVDAQKEALKRNYENVQKDLQRKIQTSKENIQKLIQQQEATTNRMEVGFLRKQQEQELAKQEALQAEYDQEETRYAVSNEELNQEITALNKQLDEAKENVQKAMVAEYQSFYEKIMKTAYENAESRVAKEKTELRHAKDKNEKDLIVVQTQVKRLIDENETLRARFNEGKPVEEQIPATSQVQEVVQEQEAPKGQYDVNGNYVYEDGSYHDPNGLFHDVDGKIYDMNGTLIREPEDDKIIEPTPVQEAPVQQEPVQAQPVQEPVQPKPAEYMVEDVSLDEIFGEPAQPTAPVQAQPAHQSEPAPQPEQTPVQTEPASVQPTYVAEKAPAQSASRGRGRPKKVVTEPAQPKEPKKRGRPKKNESSIGSKTSANKTTAKRSPYKTTTSKAKANDDLDLVSLAKINKLITEEESRLSKMKALVNSEITDALNDNEAQEINDERQEIMKAVEALRMKAEEAKQEGKSEQELAGINARLESLIKEISELNKK